MSLLDTLVSQEESQAKREKANVPSVVHPMIGETVTSDDGELRITLIGKKQCYGDVTANTWDTDINSPKSVKIHPNGRKYYVNSLEGCRTVCYDMQTGEKLKVIHHIFQEGRDDHLWTPPSGLYSFTHYTKDLNAFSGKPVESSFSHQGRFLWVPYYRRSYDINAQDPSAVAVIDTRGDSIVRLMETGPLPKMITTSPDGKTIAISHWDNNTVGLIDISSANPHEWHHTKVLVVDYVLPLNFPLGHSVDRDNGSGYALRGTVFTPDGKHLLVGCMGGGGGIAVIDIERQQYLGRVLGMWSNVRHLVISHGFLYLSINGAGVVQRIKLSDFYGKDNELTGKTVTLNNWEECQVGRWARTICITPDGHYIFAACNAASQLYVVDTYKMKVVCLISADSYPVGLDLSFDGHYAFTTSQGRSHFGGNAVDIFEIEYKHPPLDEECKEEEKGLQIVMQGGSTNSPNKFLFYAGAAVLCIGPGCIGAYNHINHS